jgi:hypothetical protein
MTDSIKLSISIEHVVASDEELDTLPFLVDQNINHYGEVLSSTPKPRWIKSPLTGAKVVVTPVFQNNKLARKGELIGYEISVNVPACVIGNNALLQILVYWCCLFALEFLKSYLLQEGCSPAIVNQLDLEHSSIKWLALTHLLDCKDRAEANRYNALIESYGDATLNTKHTNLKQKKPITTWSSAGQATVNIFKPRANDAHSYVKVGPTPNSFESFQSAEVREAVYAESRNKVRVEINTIEKWLIANGGNSPLAWKNKAKAAELVFKAFKEIKDYLRVSENLRSKRPKPDQLAKLPPADQTILLDYFDGVDPKQHPSMAGKSMQYLSSIKRNIESELRIDITIPWAIHSTKISPDLPIWMQLPDEYQAPDHLVDHCFVRETAKAKLKQLRQINADLAAAMTPTPIAKKHPGNAVKQQSTKPKSYRQLDDDDSSDISNHQFFEGPIMSQETNKPQWPCLTPPKASPAIAKAIRENAAKKIANASQSKPARPKRCKSKRPPGAKTLFD